MTIAGSGGSGSGSISQSHGSADPDPDPPKNDMDPEHCYVHSRTDTGIRVLVNLYLLVVSIWYPLH
jgi:hypothetical protein